MTQNKIAHLAADNHFLKYEKRVKDVSNITNPSVNSVTASKANFKEQKKLLDSEFNIYK